jgi:hypothetical protein
LKEVNPVANYRSTIIKDELAFDDELNPGASFYDIIRPRTTLDAVFDDQYIGESEKTLRDILEEIKFDVAHRTGIVFPVNSVQGREGDVVITKKDVGLDLIDNILWDERLLSPRMREEVRSDVNEVVQEYFNNPVGFYYPVLSVNGQEGHVNIDFESLDADGDITTQIGLIVSGIMDDHNELSVVHENAFQSIKNTIDNMIEVDSGLSSAIGELSSAFGSHKTSTDSTTHQQLFDAKEDVSYKQKMIVAETPLPTRDIWYPTVGATIDYVKDEVDKRMDSFSPSQNSIERLLHMEIRDSELELHGLNPMSYIGKVWLVKSMNYYDNDSKYNGIVSVRKQGDDNAEFVRMQFGPTEFTGGLVDNHGSIGIDRDNFKTETENDDRYVLKDEISLETGTTNGAVKLVISPTESIEAKICNIQPHAFQTKIKGSDIKDHDISDDRFAEIDGYTLKGRDENSYGPVSTVSFKNVLKRALQITNSSADPSSSVLINSEWKYPYVTIAMGSNIDLSIPSGTTMFLVIYLTANEHSNESGYQHGIQIAMQLSATVPKLFFRPSNEDLAGSNVWGKWQQISTDRELLIPVETNDTHLLPPNTTPNGRTWVKQA